MLKERDLALNALKENVCAAHNRMKKLADRKRRELKFKVEDEVYLKLRPYRQHSLARKKCEKLAPKYYRPYKIIEEIREVAYRLLLPPEAIIHNVFNISLVNHQFIQKLKLVVEGKFNYISPTLPLTCGLQIFERPNKWN